MLSGDTGLKSVLFSELPLTWSEEDFAEVFGHFGRVTHLKLLHPRGGGARVFVTYEKAAVARQSLDEFNGASIGNMKCRAEACRFDPSDFEGTSASPRDDNKTPVAGRATLSSSETEEELLPRCPADSRERETRRDDRREEPPLRRNAGVTRRTEGPERQRDRDRDAAARRQRDDDEIDLLSDVEGPTTPSRDRDRDRDRRRNRGGRGDADSTKPTPRGQRAPRDSAKHDADAHERRPAPEKTTAQDTRTAPAASKPKGRVAGQTRQARRPGLSQQPLMSRLGLTAAGMAPAPRAHPYKSPLDPSKATRGPAVASQRRQGPATDRNSRAKIENKRLGRPAQDGGGVQKVGSDGGAGKAVIENQRLSARANRGAADGRERAVAAQAVPPAKIENQRLVTHAVGDGRSVQQRAPVIEQVGLRAEKTVHVRTPGTGAGSAVIERVGCVREARAAPQFQKQTRPTGGAQKTFQKASASAAPTLEYQRMR